MLLPTPSSLHTLWPLDWHEGGRSWWADLGGARVSLTHQPGRRWSCRVSVSVAGSILSTEWDAATPEDAVPACRGAWREWATRTAVSLRKQAEALDVLATETAE